MSWLTDNVGVVVALAPFVGAAVMWVSTRIPLYIKRLQWRARRLYIGVVGWEAYDQATPLIDANLPEFTTKQAAVKSGRPCSVIICKTLSYALRHCDYVIAQPNGDVKIIAPTNHARIRRILEVKGR